MARSKRELPIKCASCGKFIAECQGILVNPNDEADGILCQSCELAARSAHLAAVARTREEVEDGPD